MKSSVILSAIIVLGGLAACSKQSSQPVAKAHSENSHAQPPEEIRPTPTKQKETAWVTAIKLAYNSRKDGQLSLDQVMAVVSSGSFPQQTTPIEKQEVILLLAEAVRALSPTERVSIASIQPDPSGDPIRLQVPAADGKTPDPPPILSIEGSSGLADVRSVGGMVFPPGTDSIAEAFIATTGDSVMDGLNTQRRNVSCSLSIRSQVIGDSSITVLFTALPFDVVPYALGKNGEFSGQADAVIPTGNGTIVAFSGEVSEFYPGWTMKSDPTEPLYFVLLPSNGLTYMFGKGSARGPGNETREFTRPFGQ